MIRKRGFTLIELLVVIAIIALLVSILMPALSKAREVAKGSVCQSNLRNIYPGLHLYMNDHDGTVTGWFGHGDQTVPGPLEPGQTCWSLELYRTMGGSSARWTDTRAIWDSRTTTDWQKSMPIVMCPKDVDKGYGTKTMSSYKPNLSTWRHYNGTKPAFLLNPEVGYWHPTGTMYFNFARMRRPGDSVMLSEIRNNNVFQVTDGTSQASNAINFSNPNELASSLRARFPHPGAGKVRDSLGRWEWEGTSAYLFFDGHVGLRQLPPYAFSEGSGGGAFSLTNGTSLTSYAVFSGS